MGRGFYRELTDYLKEHGCYFVRPGKGSHEMWFSPLSNRTFTIPPSTDSRHTVNEICKQAGLPKRF
jgi:predicted RNA binding protein YcfA (HicA-like mRNA interferase family)